MRRIPLTGADILEALSLYVTAKYPDATSAHVDLVPPLAVLFAQKLPIATVTLDHPSDNHLPPRKTIEA